MVNDQKKKKARAKSKALAFPNRHTMIKRPVRAKGG